uniref:Sulfatase N-terminal domain-containing protein n=1 Tax=Stomoxys calcitrans TaxID=35570 RepID=A0A1I8NSS9_STOCA
MVSKLDESVGRIIHSLGKASRLDNSIVLFYSDNGGPTVGTFNNTGSNWPLRGQKFSPWEGAVRVPAAIWSPLLKKKSSISEQPIYVGDFLPTLAAAANIKIKHKIDGVNVWPHLMSGKPFGWTSKDKETELFETFEDIWNLTSDMNDQYKYLKAHKTEGWPLNNLEPDFLHSLNEIWNLTSYTKDQYNHLMTVEPDGGSLQHKEPEILHMMDEIWNLTSYMRGQYKYILGTTIDGQYDGVLSQRNPNVIDPRDGKYEQTIKSTLTSKALGKYDDKKLSNELIRKLRSKSEIVCPNSGTPCDALSEECLYNIWLDPCEQNNLARHPKYAKILNEMRQGVEFFRSTAVPPKTGGIKPEYGPSRHNCLWSNYLEEAPTDYILQCDYGSPPCQT